MTCICCCKANFCDTICLLIDNINHGATYSNYRSFFQSVCVLGYCLTPVAASLIVCKVILLAPPTKLLFFVRLLTTVTGFLWATYGNHNAFNSCRLTNPMYFTASHIFLGDSQPASRKMLAVYPIFLFYFIISWLVISHSSM